MANMHEKTQVAERKPAQAHQKKPFAGRKALISTMLEDVEDKGVYTQTGFDTLLVSGRSDARAERELSQFLGASVSIVSAQNLDINVGQDEADRFIAGAEAKKKSR